MTEKEYKTLEKKFKVFLMPFQMGVFLAINAVRDIALIIDGPNCSMSKAEFIYGNHDINSTLLSSYGKHRIVYTMTYPERQNLYLETKLRTMASVLQNSGEFGLIIITGAGFSSLSGFDYDKIAMSSQDNTPIIALPVKTLENDWLAGYDAAISAMASALPDEPREKRKNTAAITGYFFERNEGDCLGNIREMKRLLGLCGIELVSVFPDGGTFKDLSKALEAEYIISLPYSGNVAKIIAKKSGAKIIETKMPIGYAGTTLWLKQICDQMDINLPQEIYYEENQSMRQYLNIASTLRHKPVFFAGDPYLYESLSLFLKEIGMRPDMAVLDCNPRKLSVLPERLLFAPTAENIYDMYSNLPRFEKPAALIGNSFSMSEKFAADIPFIELGFPSYSYHCLTDSPYFGYTGAMNLTARLLNSQLEKRR